MGREGGKRFISHYEQEVNKEREGSDKKALASGARYRSAPPTGRRGEGVKSILEFTSEQKSKIALDAEVDIEERMETNLDELEAHAVRLLEGIHTLQNTMPENLKSDVVPNIGRAIQAAERTLNRYKELCRQAAIQLDPEEDKRP